MDLSGIIIVVSGTALFFGFVLWMALISRRNNRNGDLNIGDSESYFLKKKTKNGTKRF